LHAVGAAVIFASFLARPLLPLRLAFAVRAAVTLLVILGPLLATRGPGWPGLRRSLTRLALWMLPAGNAWVAIAPVQKRAGLHVLYLGCFAALALVLSHELRAPSAGEAWDPTHRRTDELAAAAWLLAIALFARVLLEVDPPDFHLL